MTDAQPVVMGLDQSPRATGWAIGPPGSTKATTGVFRMKPWGDDEADRLDEFFEWMMERVAAHMVTHIFCESPYDAPGKSYGVDIKQHMQIAVILLVAKRCCARVIDRRTMHSHAPIWEIPAPKWRKSFLGSAAAGAELKGEAARSDLKQRAIRMCALRGYDIADDNEAEAVGIWDYGCAQISTKHAGATAVLFRRAELKRDRENYIGQK